MNRITYVKLDIAKPKDVDPIKLVQILKNKLRYKVTLSIDERETNIDNGHLEFFGKSLDVEKIVKTVEELGIIYNGIDEIRIE